MQLESQCGSDRHNYMFSILNARAAKVLHICGSESGILELTEEF